MKIQGFLALSLLLLVGCSPSPSSNSATASSTPDTLPEEKLAWLDAKKEADAVKPYAEALDQLQSKCYESRQDIAVMVFAVVKKEKEAGFPADHLDMLQSFNFAADSLDKKPGACIDIYKYFRDSVEEEG
jgi:hypothetical protein